MNTDIFKINNDKLIFKTGQIIEFDYAISERFVSMIDFIIVIILEIPPKVMYNENVFGVSTTGNLLWQINVSELNFREKNCPFTTSFVNDEGQLVVNNWCDTAVILNAITGQIIDNYQIK